MFFSSDVGFSKSACRCDRVFGGAAAFLEPLRRHSAGRIESSFRRPLAPMGIVMQQTIKNFIYQPIFTIFAAKNSAISRL